MRPVRALVLGILVLSMPGSAAQIQSERPPISEVPSVRSGTESLPLAVYPATIGGDRALLALRAGDSVRNLREVALSLVFELWGGSTGDLAWLTNSLPEFSGRSTEIAEAVGARDDRGLCANSAFSVRERRECRMALDAQAQAAHSDRLELQLRR